MGNNLTKICEVDNEQENDTANIKLAPAGGTNNNRKATFQI